MMLQRGYEVFLYSGDENRAVCTEHIPLFSEALRADQYGKWDENNLFGNIDWSPDSGLWPLMNARAIEAIRERAQPQDFLCLVAGWSQSPIVDALPELMPVEWAVGYYGIHLQHRVFESYAWMHHVYGCRNIQDGIAYDAVIPNFFDPHDFVSKPVDKDDYLLFIGRLVQRKGPHVAALIAERCGKRLLVAGPGAVKSEPGRIECPEIVIAGDGVEYVGPVGLKERARLMAHAQAVLVPTQYIEPFGGVAVEAMMSGTPAVATDWGAFTETVVESISGARFRTLAEGVDAVQRAVQLDSSAVRDFALEHYSLHAVGIQFDTYFRRLNKLYGDGWYT